MEIDPLEYVESGDEGETSSRKVEAEGREERERSRLNALVAITVALLASFMSFCNVKNGNIVQNMQQAQAKSIDTWAWYQARKIRSDVASATAAELRVQAQAQPARVRKIFENAAADYEKLTAEQNAKLKQTQADAEAYDRSYERYNFHDDQFDASEAFLSLSITLLALTSLTQKRWLYGLAMVPTFFGVVMGFAGLLALRLYLPWLAKLLS